MHSKVVSALLVGAPTLIANAVTPALAQSTGATPSRTDTIVVTGTRPAYRGEFDALETPQAELTIDADTLRNAGAADLSQALDLSASVSRQNNFGGLWNSFAVRGFVGDANLPSNFLVNGFNAGRGFGGPRDLSGIESVEVLKGPRAALYGRGEPGGTINLVTKRPTFETAGEFRLSGARFDAYRADADWTTPITDAVAIRLVGYYEDAGSFRDTVESQGYGASPSLAWRLSNGTQVVYEMEYSHQEVPFDRGVVSLNGRLGVVPSSRFLGEPGDGPIEADVLGHQLELQHDFNDDWSALVGFNYRDTSLEGFSTEPELTANRQRLLVDGQTLTRQRRFRDYDATYRVLRAEISGKFATGGVEHRLLAGLDTDEFENDQVFLRARAPTLASNPTLQQLQAINIFAPVYGQYPLPTPTPLTNQLDTQQSTGAFVQDQIGVTERFDVRLGARFDDYKLEIRDRAAGSVRKQSDSRVSPQVGVVFAATDRVSWYAVYGENFRPLASTDFSGRPFDPNLSTSMEAGVKFTMRGGALVGSASVFRIEQENILVADPLNAGFNIAAGEAQSQGIELDLQGQVTEGVSLWASYAYVDVEVQNDVLDPDFAKVIRAGDRLLNVPKHTLSLQLGREFAIAGRSLSVGGGLLYVGERLGEVGTGFELPDYTLVRLFAAHDLTESLSLRAEIDNVFDETYYTNSYSQLWIQPGTPRSLRLSAAFRF
jgi:iron complex outermembrane recepter protein